MTDKVPVLEYAGFFRWIRFNGILYSRRYLKEHSVVHHEFRNWHEQQYAGSAHGLTLEQMQLPLAELEKMFPPPPGKTL